MSIFPIQKNYRSLLPATVDPSIQETTERYETQIKSAIQQLPSLESDIESRKRTIFALRNRLYEEIRALDEDDEAFQIARERIKLADAFLNAPSEHIEMIIAREYLDALDDK